jgi:glucuronate isomerase
LISPETAREIWDEANRQIAQTEFSATGILKKFHVEVLCTTDDPTDTLAAHQSIAKSHNFPTRVFPTYRPDKAMKLSDPAAFYAWCDLLAQRSGGEVANFAGFVDALRERHVVKEIAPRHFSFKIQNQKNPLPWPSTLFHSDVAEEHDKSVVPPYEVTS